MAVRRLYIDVSLRIQKFLSHHKRLRGALNLLGSTFRAVFRTAVVAGFFLALRSVFMTFQRIKTSITNLGKEMSELNLAAVRTATVLTKGGIGTGRAFEVVSQQARELSTQVSYTAKQIQEGFFTAAIAGYNLKDSMKVASSAMKLAEVGGAEFGKTINDLIGIVNAFHIQLTELPKIANMIAGAMTHSKMTLMDFFTSMRYVAPAAVSAFGNVHETLVDTSAALMTLQDAGLQSSKAGVYLRGSMQKLSGATTKAVAVFAKYGVNLYKADAASQQYLGTLLDSQSALGEYYTKLNELKQSQLDLVLSGRKGSNEFINITEKISQLNTEMGVLRAGLGDIFTQFTLAGGKMRPFGEVLSDIGRAIPVEVVGRAFGIRGGQAIQLLLNNLAKFEKHKKTLEEIDRLYEEGRDILSDMFGKMMDSFLKKWFILGNTIKTVFSILFDALADPASDILDSLIDGFKHIYKFAEKNKYIFKNLFQTIADMVKPIVDIFSRELPKAVEKLRDLVTKKDVTFTIFGIKEGAVQPIGEETVKGSASIFKKLSAFMRSIGSLISSTLMLALEALRPVFEPLAVFFVEVLITELKAKMGIFKDMGFELAKAILEHIAANAAQFEEVGKKIGEKFISFLEDNAPAIVALFVHVAWVMAKAFANYLVIMMKRFPVTAATLAVPGMGFLAPYTLYKEAGRGTTELEPMQNNMNDTSKLINDLMNDRQDFTTWLNDTLKEMERRGSETANYR